MWRRPISTHVSSGPRSRCRLTCASVPAKSRGFKQCIIAVLAALTGCARTTPTLSTQAFCQRTKPAPADWREVRLPASAATMRLPPSYLSEGQAGMDPTARALRSPGDHIVASSCTIARRYPHRRRSPSVGRSAVLRSPGVQSTLSGRPNSPAPIAACCGSRQQLGRRCLGPMSW